MSKGTPFLMFNDQFEAAMEFYTATFPNSHIRNVARNGKDGPVASAERSPVRRASLRPHAPRADGRRNPGSSRTQRQRSHSTSFRNFSAPSQRSRGLKVASPSRSTRRSPRSRWRGVGSDTRSDSARGACSCDGHVTFHATRNRGIKK